MKAAALLLLFLVPSVWAFQPSDSTEFPNKPDVTLTPGELCDHPDSFRYPEKIPYCDREVETETKEEIIHAYDQILDFKIEALPRSQFKIDHYIPLCMGGSNSIHNLWPQHRSIYKITDSLEQALCDKMAEGKISQDNAVQLIKEAKNNLEKTQQILEKVNSL